MHLTFKNRIKTKKIKCHLHLLCPQPFNKTQFTPSHPEAPEKSPKHCPLPLGFFQTSNYQCNRDQRISKFQLLSNLHNSDAPKLRTKGYSSFLLSCVLLWSSILPLSRCFQFVCHVWLFISLSLLETYLELIFLSLTLESPPKEHYWYLVT